MIDEPRPPLPPFTPETAAHKARAAEDAWNSRDPDKVSLAYTPDSVWRNRTEFLQGREAIVGFLTRKWAAELDYRLIKEVWGFRENRMAVRFAYECHDAGRRCGSAATATSCGSSTTRGLMGRRIASINDLAIAEAERLFHWPPWAAAGRPSGAERVGAVESPLALSRPGSAGPFSRRNQVERHA